MTMESNRDNKTLDGILGPTEPEVTCEQCFDLLDQYVELELAGADADTQLPGLRAHLAGCPACREDYASLRDFVSAQRSPAD
jgi:predicted anti-sigma-YlaC factor YlaD